MKKTLVNLVNILEIHLLPEIARGYGSTIECRIAQKTFCNYVATANEEEMENIKNINSQYQVGLFLNIVFSNHFLSFSPNYFLLILKALNNTHLKSLVAITFIIAS